MIVARFGWRSFLVNRKEVGRRMLTVFRCLVRNVLRKGEGNDPVFLRQEMRRSDCTGTWPGPSCVLGWNFVIESD